MKTYLQKIITTFKATLLTCLVVGLLVCTFFYFASYSNGYRAGVVYKMSNKGIIFKTNEGEMNTGNYVVEGDKIDNNLSTKIWKFSVSNDQTEVLKQLESAVLTGKRVKLYYKEMYIRVFWRGDTKYLIYKVEEAP